MNNGKQDPLNPRFRQLQARVAQLDESPEKALLFEAMNEIQETIRQLNAANEELQQQQHALLNAYAQLEQEHQYYRNLFEFAPVGYLITAHHGMIKEANHMAVSMFNLNPNFLLSKPLAVFIVDSERHYFRRQLALLDSGSPVQVWETKIKPRKKPPVEVMFTVVRSASAKRWLIYDLTERRKIETAELDRGFKATFEHAGIGIAHLSLKGAWLRTNSKLLEILGYDEAEIGNYTISSFVHRDELDGFTAAFQKFLADGTSYYATENRFVRKDGNIVWCRLTISKVKTTLGLPQYLILVLENITLQRQVQEQEKLLAVQEERQRIARELHDAVTQSLFASKLIAESLPNALKENPESIETSLQELKTLNTSAVAEMRLLLLELKPQQLSRASLSTNLNYLISALKGRKKIEVQTHIQENSPAPQEVQIVFYRVAQEAINNIIKHSQAKRVEINLESKSNQVYMEVKDNGIGFDVEKTPPGFGIENMRERAASIHAEFTLTSGKKGTQIRLLWQP